MWARVGSWIDAVLFGSLFALRHGNKVIQNEIDACNIEQFKEDARLKCTTEDLEATLCASIQRIERIEDKARGTLLGVTVAIAVLGATSGLLGTSEVVGGKNYLWQVTAASLLFLAMLYSLRSGLLALAAYKVGMVYSPTLTDRVPVDDLSTSHSVTLYSIEQNQRTSIGRSNLLSASLDCLRNGLIVVLVLGGLVIVSSFLHGTKTGDEGSVQEQEKVPGAANVVQLHGSEGMAE